jgi:cyclopropane-fatty-acyl-phospholipid synthase
MNMILLRNLLRGVVRTGTLKVSDHRGNSESFGSGAPSVSIKFAEKAPLWRWFLSPDLAVGEFYMDGLFQVEDGDIYDFLSLCFANLHWRCDHWLWSARTALHGLHRRFGRGGVNSIAGARGNSARHYDLSDELYALFLDEDRQYSCAYYKSPDDTLERAQEQKKTHLAAKLLLQPGQRVLDIGCGWGGFALYLARVADVEVTGLTLSDEQCAYARRRAREAGLQNRVRFEVRDYRLARGSYDRIVSVGMFEHVGIAHYREYFEKIRDLLAADGIGLVHTIGGGQGGFNPWIDKYIFPGGEIPALSDIVPLLERLGLFITDIEVLRLHYAETLKAWRTRFCANRARALELYDERFYRMWEFYLASCEAGFRHAGLVNFQVQLSKKLGVVPVTRDYIWDYEQESFAAPLAYRAPRAS